MNSFSDISLEKALKHYNYFHDAIITKLELIKTVDVDPISGDVFYPFEDVNKINNSNISIEVIHNSYDGAKIDQRLKLKFFEVNEVGIIQKKDNDLSNIYEVACPNNNYNQVVFYASEKKIPVIKLTFNDFMIIEL